MQRTRLHELSDIIVITICGAICGVDNWVVEIERFGNAKIRWFRTFLALPHAIPSHDTFGCVFAALEPAVCARADEQDRAAGGERAVPMPENGPPPSVSRFPSRDSDSRARHPPTDRSLLVVAALTMRSGYERCDCPSL
jgi:hypothetical protein